LDKILWRETMDLAWNPAQACWTDTAERP